MRRPLVAFSDRGDQRRAVLLRVVPALPSSIRPAEAHSLPASLKAALSRTGKPIPSPAIPPPQDRRRDRGSGNKGTLAARAAS
jgi:hypothetical protein